MLLNIEHAVFYFFNHFIVNPVCDVVIKFFMMIPGGYVFVFISAMVFFLSVKKYHRFSAMTVLTAFVISQYTYRAIKYFIQRPRPFQTLDDVRLLLGEHGGFSFPSGHSTTSFCIATVIAMRYPKLRYPAFIAALLVALSRPYVGVHYPSDILVGSILGMLIGYVTTRTAEKYISES